MSVSPPDSLFGDEPEAEEVHFLVDDIVVGAAQGGSLHAAASRRAPSIPGLSLHRDVLTADNCESVLRSVAECGYFGRNGKDAATSAEHGERDTQPSDAFKRPNQVMLFGRASTDESQDADDEMRGDTAPASGLPVWADELVHTLATALKERLDDATHALLFPRPSFHKSDTRSGVDDGSVHPNIAHSASKPSSSGTARFDSETGGLPCSRQLILNLYHPGQGISPHVDLLSRFGDGIIVCSFGGGTVMQFAREPGCQDDEAGKKSRQSAEEEVAVYLPAHSVLVLKGPARYKWTHGISARDEDWVLDDASGDEEHVGANAAASPDGSRKPRARLLRRSLRLSITIRWLLPGADVVGGAH